MAGQIIKRGNRTFVVRIFQGRNANGKRRYLNKTMWGNKKDAEAYLSATLAAISTGTFVEPSGLTLDDYLNRWLDAAAKPQVSERTFAEYTALLRRYVRKPLGKTTLSDLRPLTFKPCIRKCSSATLARASFVIRTQSYRPLSSRRSGGACCTATRRNW